MAAPRGRGTGVPNYKNEILITIIEAILPNCSTEWETVCKRYKIASEERIDRDAHDVKRHFMIHKSLCDSNKKVTGSAAPKPSVARCQAIFLKICRKGSAGCYGDVDEDETNDSDSGEDDESRQEREFIEESSDEPPLELADEVPVILDAEPEKQPAVSKKRPATEPEESRKSKNCRNKARGGAGAALSSLAEVLTKKHSSAAASSTEPNFMQIMMMNMQQQQQQQMQQQMQYQQAQEQSRIQSNQQFQMMLMMMGNRGQGNNNGNDSNFMYPNSPCTTSLVEPSSTSSSSSSRLLDRFDEYPDRNS